MAGETWEQVLLEKDPSKMQPADVANVGPAPRDLTPGMKQYIKKTKPSFAKLWIFVAFWSVASYAIMVASIGWQNTFLVGSVWPIGATAAAVYSYRKSKRGRAALTVTMRDGHLRFARVTQNIQSPVGRGLSKRYRYTARFDVDGRTVPLVTMNDGMGMLQPGQLVEVLFAPESPDEIVPTFLLV